MAQALFETMDITHETDMLPNDDENSEEEDNAENAAASFLNILTKSVKEEKLEYLSPQNLIVDTLTSQIFSNLLDFKLLSRVKNELITAQVPMIDKSKLLPVWIISTIPPPVMQKKDITQSSEKKANDADSADMSMDHADSADMSMDEPANATIAVPIYKEKIYKGFWTSEKYTDHLVQVTADHLVQNINLKAVMMTQLKQYIKGYRNSYKNRLLQMQINIHNMSVQAINNLVLQEEEKRKTELQQEAQRKIEEIVEAEFKLKANPIQPFKGAANSVKYVRWMNRQKCRILVNQLEYLNNNVDNIVKQHNRNIANRARRART
eukprot:30032_1